MAIAVGRVSVHLASGSAAVTRQCSWQGARRHNSYMNTGDAERFGIGRGGVMVRGAGGDANTSKAYGK